MVCKINNNIMNSNNELEFSYTEDASVSVGKQFPRSPSTRYTYTYQCTVGRYIIYYISMGGILSYPYDFLREN